ncbi:hypothetical protein JOQ06_008839 [Pogonophryne albipinna]|uniref:Uncharacterized protein n=1 Tax=Pogonophryne albipinna TaxID=1090488 RepID=A0AAD6BN12_9TELE|nr:hypothetical protein JOQ06_008839 [Pogonophryne albipinna]
MEHVTHRQREQHFTLMRQPANANSWESNPMLDLSRELEETRRELAREKNLTKRFLNEEQETRRKLEEAKQKLARKAKWNELSITKEKDIQDEFESLKRTCDPESMNTFMIATEVQNNIKRTMKKELHHEFEQVKVAYSINKEHFYQKIQFERRNQAALQQELEQLRGPHPSSLSFGSELRDSLQEQRESEDMELLSAESLMQRMSQKIQSVKNRKNSPQPSRSCSPNSGLKRAPSNPSIDMSRGLVIRCLMVYLGVHRPTPKEYDDPDEDNVSQDLAAASMTIYRAKNNATEDIGIVVEGIKVLTALGTFPRACSLLIGLACALNLAYPKEIRQTLEVFQKLFLELDCSKLSPKGK